MEDAITLRQKKSAAYSGMSLLIALIVTVSVYILIVGANMAEMRA